MLNHKSSKFLFISLDRTEFLITTTTRSLLRSDSVGKSLGVNHQCLHSREDLWYCSSFATLLSVWLWKTILQIWPSEDCNGLRWVTKSKAFKDQGYGGPKGILKIITPNKTHFGGKFGLTVISNPRQYCL